MREFDPKHAAQNGYSRTDWDAVESPELEAEDLKNAKAFSEVFPTLAESARKSLGRPKLAKPKIAVSLRLDADVLEAFKASGQGWQSRMNEALRKAAHLSR